MRTYSISILLAIFVLISFSVVGAQENTTQKMQEQPFARVVPLQGFSGFKDMLTEDEKVTLEAIMQLRDQLVEDKGLEARKRTGRRMIELGNELLEGRMARAKAAEIDIAAAIKSNVKPTSAQRTYLTFWVMRASAAVAADDESAGRDAASVFNKMKASEVLDEVHDLMVTMKLKGWLGVPRQLANASMQAPFVNSLGMKFVPVPGTKVLFCIHETRNVDYEAYSKSLSGVNREWEQALVEARSSGFISGDGLQHPVVNVSADDASSFCKWLSSKESLSYRLPTDHEWSCAVGIGEREDPAASPLSKRFKLKHVYPWGGDFPPPASAGNYQVRTNGRYTDAFDFTAPVMSFEANQFGLFDLGGNVWEWCSTLFTPEDPTSLEVRGGAWNTNYEDQIRSDCRMVVGPDVRVSVYGFRCVIVLQ